jgi:SAM-dependent methyltransferase
MPLICRFGDDEAFDIVSCHQGLQFFADTPAAVREMRRTLAPGGRLALATWRPVQDIPVMRDLQEVAERHLGPIADQRHSFGDADVLRRLLGDAGFRAIQIETVTLTIRMNDGAVFPRLNTMALVGMNAAAKAMSEEQRAQVTAAITNDSIDAVQPYLDGGELVFDLSSNMAIARA